MATASEKSIEKASCKAIQLELRDPDSTPKHGEEGWPDRQVLLGNGHHFWLEFKKLTGKLRHAQVERNKRLRARGERVYEPRSEADALAALHYEMRLLGCFCYHVDIEGHHPSCRALEPKRITQPFIREQWE